MDLNKIKEDIINKTKDLDVFLYSIDYKNENGVNILEVVFDKKGFVDISDIEAATNIINDYLDKTDPISEDYSLEVTSRGIDKEISFDDANYYLKEYVEIKTMDQLHKGELIEKKNDSLVIKDSKNKKVIIKANDIVSINIAIKF